MINIMMLQRFYEMSFIDNGSNIHTVIDLKSITEMYSYLKYMHTSTKATWLKAREDLRSQ